jgi:D-tyrosyl-tRNA(Tyr) deacylase
MNLAVGDVSGGVLAVSQFTLLADARKGRRPFFGAAADPETARRLYACFTAELRALGCPCEEGIFRAHMEVASTNDGPVTIILDSRDLAASGGGAAH